MATPIIVNPSRPSQVVVSGTQKSGTPITINTDLDYTRVRSMINEALGDIDIDTTELAKEATLNKMSSKLDNINVEVDLTQVAKQGKNPEATLSAVYDTLGEVKKLVAEFETSSLPKVNVSTISISNDCLNEEGTWKDFTRINPQNIRGFNFYDCNNLLFLDASGWVTSKMTGSLIQNFRNCNSLQWLNSASWDMSKVTQFTDNTFVACRSLTSLIGNKTIEDVIGDDVVCMKGMKISFGLYHAGRLDRASLRAVINGLADLTGQTAQTLTLGATLLAKLTDEDIAIATNKNWTIV